jgi:hypothetical protein
VAAASPVAKLAGWAGFHFSIRQKIDLTEAHGQVYSTGIEANAHLNGRRVAAEPRFLPSVIGQNSSGSGGVMVAGTCQIAFTTRQWEAYEFVLKFHRLRYRAPTAVELGQGLGIGLVESAKLIGALTTKGVLERRVYHVLAVVPPNYERQEIAED